VAIRVRTEPLFSALEHDIFFNRGVASKPGLHARVRQQEARPAHGRQAREGQGMAEPSARRRHPEFIADAGPDDTLLCCFYEFRYQPVAEALAAALKRGVDVQLIVDAKKNKPKDAKGKATPSFPRTENLAMIEKVGIPMGQVFLREARTNAIQHNKFMVLLKGQQKKPAEVWTGSTTSRTAASTARPTSATGCATGKRRRSSRLLGDPEGGSGRQGRRGQGHGGDAQQELRTASRRS